MKASVALASRFRSAYDGQSADYSLSATQADFGPSLAHQSFLDECDINRIVRQWDQTGLFSSRPDREPVYFDASEVPDFQSSLNQVIAAQAAFDALPAQVRKRFSNNPAEFVAFAADPANGEEMVRLGLAVERAPEVPPVDPSVLPAEPLAEPPAGS